MKNELFEAATKLKDGIIGIDVILKNLRTMTSTQLPYYVTEIPESAELFENFKKELISICLAKKEDLEANFNNL